MFFSLYKSHIFIKLSTFNLVTLPSHEGIMIIIMRVVDQCFRVKYACWFVVFKFGSIVLAYILNSPNLSFLKNI